MAREAGLRVADKPDSQEICFIPDNDYAAFVARYRGADETAGDLVDTAGNVLGRHDGYHHFTIGQRRGLGVAFGSPRFVVAIEPATRRVVIGTQADLARHELEADGVNWLAPTIPSRFACRAKIRYRHEAAAAEVTVEGDRIHVLFAQPQYGVTPGQAVVLYDGDRVLGGGWIKSTNDGKHEARMTKEAPSTKHSRRGNNGARLSFRSFGHWCFLRHSDFVLPALAGSHCG